MTARWRVALGSATACAMAVFGPMSGTGAAPGTSPSMGVVREEEAHSELRIEDEYKLKVPDEIAEAAWTFLGAQLNVVPPAETGLGGKIAKSISVEFFNDLYYDTSDFTLLGSQSSVRLRERSTPDDPDGRKSGRRLVQLKINSAGDREQTRGEYKFEVRQEGLPAASYPPINQLIRRADLEPFFIKVGGMGVDARDLHPVLTVSQERRRVYVDRNGEPLATVTLDFVTAKRFLQTESFVEIEVELSENTYTEADSAGREVMQRYSDFLAGQIRHAFPGIAIDQTPKYNKSFARLDSRVPLFRYLIRMSWLR